METDNHKITPKEVERLLKNIEPLASKIERAFTDGVAIYGAGFVGTWACDYLKSLKANISFFIDRDRKKNGTTIQGVPVIHPTDQQIPNNASIFIAARHAVNAVTTDMAKDDRTLLSFDAYYVYKNYLKLTSIRDQYFTDKRSTDVFNAVLIAMLSSKTDSCRAVMEKDMYFSIPEFSGNFEEIFVDAGAFVGDTVERFIWENLGTFKHIYAFEPGYKQFKALEKRIDRLSEEWAFDNSSVTLVNAGLSSKYDQMECSFVDDFPLRHGLTGIAKTGDNIKSRYIANVYSLDSYLNGKQVTFIKADVEGMEMELLRGAQETIQRFAPKMAICVYHYPSHLIDIIEYVRKLVPQYKFCLRQHAPIFGDFVLYCYTDSSTQVQL